MIETKKIKTGIRGLDTMLKGGLQPGRGLLLIGGPGTGKTILLSEFIYRGITEFQQNGVFVTFEERPEYIIENLKSLGWKLDQLVKQNRFIFIDSSPSHKCEEVSDCYNLEPLLARLRYAVTKNKAKRVVIDGLGGLFQKFSARRAVREFLFSICDELKKMNVTYLISTEKSGQNDYYSIGEYVADGVLDVDRTQNQDRVSRSLEIVKLRGASYLAGKTTFEINDNGIVVYPRLVLDNDSYLKRPRHKCKFGIADLDRALGGGLPRGSVTILVGATGTGKTTIAMSFLNEGLKNGENAVCVSFKDSRFGIETMTGNLGWSFNKYIDENRLKFITALDHPDKLLHTITGEIERSNAKRVVIDSISFIDPTNAYPEKVTRFYIDIIRWFKIKGITCIFNYLDAEEIFMQSEALFSSLEPPLRRVLTAITDGIILLRYTHAEGEVRKQLSILKLKHSNHSTEIFTYLNDDDGFRFIKNKEETQKNNA